MAKAHNEFVLQQLNLHHFITGRFRWRRDFGHCRIWRRTRLHPARGRAFQFGNYDQLLVELRQMDPSTFQFLYMDPVYDEILASVRGRIWKQHTWSRKPLEEGLELAATLRHLVIGTMYSDMRYGWIVSENTLSDVFMEMCQAICDDYADEVMAKMDRDNLLMDSTGLEISPTLLLLLMASMWQSENLLCQARFIIIYNFLRFLSPQKHEIYKNPSKFYSLYCTSLIIYTKRSFELAHELKYYAFIITMCWCIVVQLLISFLTIATGIPFSILLMLA